MTIPQAVISFSGGMDSSSLLLHLLQRGHAVHAISFYYQQRHDYELQCSKALVAYLQARDFPVEHQIVDLSSAMAGFHSALTCNEVDVPTGHYEELSMKDTVVPNRNAIFASIVYGRALSIAEQCLTEVKIGLGVHSGDHAIYPDCRPEFYEAIAHAFEIGNWQSDRVKFYLPYVDDDKATILQDAQTCCSVLSIDFTDYFSKTNTCYQPNKQHQSCGQCGSCVERLEAFDKIGCFDPINYVKIT